MTAGPLLVYNLVPTLAGPLDAWPAHARRARAMGFDWLFLNPVHYPGFSGSLYAIKDHDRLHPVLVPAGGDGGIDGLRPVLAEIGRIGLGPMTDLVVNHTSKDSPLVTAHPGWFRRDAAGQVVSPSAIDPANADDVTVWGDLAEVDNANAEDREGLWAFWESQVVRALDLGFQAFRCDAAYKVPAALWRRLIARARRERPDVLFVAETLGCRLQEMEALAQAGFDYFYNSSKWWDFEAPWCLEQHAMFRRVAPSIAFPESHDTERLAAESGGSEAVQRQRYAFAAFFSAGVQITVGYEFGFQRRLDVVATRPADWETPRFDLTGFIARVNALKRRHPLLVGEGVLARVDTASPGIAVLRRWSDEAGTHRGLIVVNRDAGGERDARLDLAELRGSPRLYRPWDEAMPDQGHEASPSMRLAPGEVALVSEAVSRPARPAGARGGRRSPRGPARSRR
jgi:starch synthase (maltosyl-transferring)